jgi:predicted nucleotidyltransferase
MTLTTAQAFDSFVATISLTEAQKTEVANKRTKTEEYLRAAFPTTSNMPLKRVILIGSADRNTLIRPLDDVDVMAEFTNKDRIFETYRYQSGQLLQRIRTALQAHTSIEQIGARGQAVRLFYKNGAHVDIAPVFAYSTGGFLLPSGDGGWITTDPEKQAKWMAGRRAAVGSNLTRVVKLLKRWNRVHSSRFSSYHLEVMIATMFSQVDTNSRKALKFFFEHASNYLDVSDPAGHSGSLSTYLTADARARINSRLADANIRAVSALASEAAGNHAEAKRLWKIELGDEFPLC